MLEFLAIGAGGFIGSCLRYVISKNFNSQYFPFGTLLSNVIAGLMIGFIIGLEMHNTAIPHKWRLFLTTGLLGGLSTFSTFSFETINLFQNGRYMYGSLNILLNVGLSLLGVLLGLSIAKILKKA